MRNTCVVGGVVLGVLFVGGVVVGQEDDEVSGGRKAGTTADAELEALHEAYLAKYKPLYLESRQAWWEASTTGSDEAFAHKQKVEGALVELHSDHETFKKLKSLKEAGEVGDPTLRRQLEVMYLAFLPGQADPALQKRIIALENEVEQTFNTHRSKVGGKLLTENDVRKVLSDSKDSAEVEAAWKGYMQVGVKVEKKLRQAVQLRNKLARQLGFRNFYVMQLSLAEIDEAELMRLFDELDTLTQEPFAVLKEEIDAARAQRFRVSVSDLQPWHFGDLFFQAAPATGALKLDELYESQDLLALGKAYYASMGLEVEDILRRSDLYEKPGKTPHAFAADMDRAGDIRILCNLKPNLYWMDTLLHELGHAVYDEYIRRDMPFILRTASHGITTEGYAMLMGAMTKNEEYLRKVLRLPPEQAGEIVQSARRALRAEKLIFCRWTQVMVRFEHGMYENPDQDLGQLWWNLKQRYQRLNPPHDVSRPDYAAKLHVVTVPVYYHNYMMGDLFACQVRHHIATKVLGLDDPGATCFFGRKEAGRYLRDEIFSVGKLHTWNELTKRATGESLSAKYFARQYVNRSDAASGRSD